MAGKQQNRGGVETRGAVCVDCAKRKSTESPNELHSTGHGVSTARAVMLEILPTAPGAMPIRRAVHRAAGECRRVQGIAWRGTPNGPNVVIITDMR